MGHSPTTRKGKPNADASRDQPTAPLPRAKSTFRQIVLESVAHAGEEGGAENVRDALTVFKVDRIDHGVHCEADPDLVDRLVERATPLTVCPCSNIMLCVFPDMTRHNIRWLHEVGLCVTINSDDPPYFGGYINENFAAIQEALGFSDDELWQLARIGSPTRICLTICAAAIWLSSIGIGRASAELFASPA
jgi:adenosine deaminase